MISSIDDSNNEFNEEAKIGISAYASKVLGFRGIHKQRFSDFIVREISSTGHIVSMTDIEGFDLEKQLFNYKYQHDTSTDSVDKVESLKEHLNQILQPSENHKSENLDQFLELLFAKSDECPNSLLAFPCSDKTIRTQIHEMFRNQFSEFIESDTIAVDGLQHIRLFAKHKLRKDNRSKFDNERPIRRARWPSNVGDFLKFSLLKENVDTISAIGIISNSLRLKPNSITYCGTKDKRAITIQQCTLYRKKPSDFKRLNQSRFNPFIRVGDFHYVSQPLRLGDLKGNEFTIILRALDCSDDVVASACEAVSCSGFINYFGLQRFGKGGTPTHEIDEWKRAVDLFFSPRHGDKKDVELAKSYFHRREYKSALNHISREMMSEKIILQHMIQHNNDFLGALDRISKNLRLLCVHAYQSYLFNMAATKRIELFGMRVVEGDLVIKTDKHIDDTTEDIYLEDVVETISGVNEESDSSSEIDGLNNDNSKVKHDESSNPNKITDIDIHVVTQQDVLSNVFTINQVILPLVGSHVQLPKNAIGAYYMELLRKDDIQLSLFAEGTSRYRSKGQYRKLIQLPGNFIWKVIPYHNPDEDIVETDILKFREPRIPPASENAIVKESNLQTPLKALHLQFTLPPGTYATMMLRELTKQSTETLYQAQLTANVSTDLALNNFSSVSTESPLKIRKLE